jgi:hypothetical protein
MDVSFSEDKFVVMIENLSWDPVKVAKDIAEDISFTSHNITSQALYASSCLQFFNAILRNIGPLIKLKGSSDAVSAFTSTTVEDEVLGSLVTGNIMKMSWCLKNFRKKNLEPIERCFSGLRVGLYDRILQNTFFFNKTRYVEGSSFGTAF